MGRGPRTHNFRNHLERIVELERIKGFQHKVWMRQSLLGVKPSFFCEGMILLRTPACEHFSHEPLTLRVE